jgi:hypothetical protein
MSIITPEIKAVLGRVGGRLRFEKIMKYLHHHQAKRRYREAVADALQARTAAQSAEIEAATGIALENIGYHSPLFVDWRTGDILSVKIVVQVSGTLTEIVAKINAIKAIQPLVTV